jgi:hypothetical protein
MMLSYFGCYCEENDDCDEKKSVLARTHRSPFLPP